MKATQSRKSNWPRKITCGRESVTIYRRKMPNGSPGYLIANYATGKRRFDSYADEVDAITAANRLARQMSERDVLTASMTKEQAVEYAAAIQALRPHGISLTATAAAVAECFKHVSGLADMAAACSFYASRHKRTKPKRVSEAVTELLSIKESRGASPRYLQDLRNRLSRFAADFQKDVSNVTTADVQAWLDGQKFSAGNYGGYRRVIHLLFEFGVSRSYCADNPIEKVERVKVNGVETEVFTPKEISKLLASASPDFLPCIAIGGFAGLRSAEIERLEWSDIHLTEKFIVVGADKAKTASRRVVPIADNLATWLSPFAEQKGLVWKGGHDAFYDAQQDTSKAAGVEWKQNALRHSFASYRFAQIGDAGRVAGELGNSAAVVHRHYRELVKPADAAKWFSIAPEIATNVVTLSATGVN